jgi:hypothetical protein
MSAREARNPTDVRTVLLLDRITGKGFEEKRGCSLPENDTVYTTL